MRLSDSFIGSQNHDLGALCIYEILCLCMSIFVSGWMSFVTTLHFVFCRMLLYKIKMADVKALEHPTLKVNHDALLWGYLLKRMH